MTYRLYICSSYMFSILSLSYSYLSPKSGSSKSAETMDPCPFVRLIVESLSLKLPQRSKSGAASAGIHPSATPCFCKLRFSNFPPQTALLPLCSAADPAPDSTTSAAGFHLDSAALRRLSGRSVTLHVSVYSGGAGQTCGITRRKLLGRVQVSVSLDGVHSKAVVFQNGWMKLGGEEDGSRRPAPRVHMVVRSEPDPRFVFQFGGEPECSPVVFQIQGSIRQPVFSCKFSADRNSGSRSLPSGRMKPFLVHKERQARERKGWMVKIYDLSGSAVAAASMVTPFVPSPGTDRVCRSNPGAWLILRPNGKYSNLSSWKPWGRLEAWRERGHVDGLGYRFELVTNSVGPTNRVPIAEATLSVKRGGEFCIDADSSKVVREYLSSSMRCPVKGFVMGSTVEGEGKVSKPSVQIGMQHVSCMGDAALFVALSAAIDLSMDACMLFSRKLPKEFFSDNEDLFL